MHALTICLTILVSYPFASAQNFNLQPQLGDYRPRVTPDYDYFNGGSPYYSKNYAPTYNGPRVVPFYPYGNYPDSFTNNDFGPFRESFPPRDFAYGTGPNLNNDFQSNPYQYFSNHRPNSDPSTFYNAPNGYINFPRAQYDNYAPTFTTPFEPPLLNTGRPFYPPLPVPIPSESPNVIREEPDGKHMSVADTSDVNKTFLNPEYNYKQIVVPDIGLPPTGNSNVITGEAFGGNLPQANLSEPNPDFRPFLNPAFPDNPISPNFPSELPPTGVPQQTYIPPQIPFGFDSEIPSSFMPKLPAQFAGYPNQGDGQTPGSTPPPFYPTSPSSVLPDITLSGSPRNIGNPSYPFRSEPSFGENAPRGFPSTAFQPSLPTRPNLVYDAPGHGVSP